MGHRFRFNSGPEFVWQQFLVDGGRRVSDTALELYRDHWERNKAINTSSFFEEMNQRLFVNFGLTDETKIRYFFERGYAFGEVTPSATFDILPPFVQKIYYMAVGKRGTKYCLRSPATPDTKCKVCGFCEDDDYSQNEITGRVIESGKTVMDVNEAIFQNKPRSVLRVVYRTVDPSMKGVDPIDAKLARYRFKIVNNHYLAARFLRAKPKLLARDFHSVGNYSDYVPTFHEMPDSWGGYGFFEIFLRTPHSELKDLDVKELIDFVNAQSQVSKVVAVYPMPYVANNLKDTKFAWRFVTPFGKEDLTERYHSYDDKMKTMDKGASAVAVVVEEPYPKDNFGLFMVQGQRQTTGFFTLGGRYNPFMAIWSLFGMKPEISRQHFIVDRIAAFDMMPIPCQTNSCNRTAGMNIFNNSKSAICPECTAKLMAMKLQGANQQKQLVTA